MFMSICNKVKGCKVPHSALVSLSVVV